MAGLSFRVVGSIEFYWGVSLVFKGELVKFVPAAAVILGARRMLFGRLKYR